MATTQKIRRITAGVMVCNGDLVMSGKISAVERFGVAVVKKYNEQLTRLREEDWIG